MGCEPGRGTAGDEGEDDERDAELRAAAEATDARGSVEQTMLLGKLEAALEFGAEGVLIAAAVTALAAIEKQRLVGHRGPLGQDRLVVRC